MTSKKTVKERVSIIRKAYFFLEGNPRAAAVFVAVSMIGVGFLDFVTGEELSFSIFYLVPIGAAAWFLELDAALAVSFAAAFVWFGIDFLVDHAKYGYTVPYWNSLVGCAFFVIVSLLLARLRSAMRSEKAVSELKTRMISFVSHEINNSLASMNMALTLLTEDNRTSTPESRKRMYEVLASVYSVIRQTSANFLNQARMQEGKMVMSKVSSDPMEAITGAADLIKPLVADKELEFSVSVPGRPVSVLADPDALLLVMTNLAGNAVKYTPRRGKVSIGLSVRDGNVTFLIEDTGIGMTPEELAKINTPYYRTEEGKKHAKGFGIGLYLCREIIRAHGSALNIESEKNKGTRMSFTLPAGEN